MIKAIDVREIHDIPNIEEYLGRDFYFNCCVRGDNTLIYECFDVFGNTEVTIDIYSTEDTFFNTHKLEDVITFDELGYLQLTYYKDDEPFKSYCWRPSVEESLKNYNNEQD